MKNKIQLLAYYLPQFHPIPENDEWWGKGFTEWTNVTKAKTLFRGHKQPNLPADLGFYDLRIPEVQEEQSRLALEHGIDGFIYYHYWFGNNNKMLLEKPAEAMLANKNIKIPFCFCWANETWKGIWHGLKNDEVLIEQKYPLQVSGYNQFFEYLLPFFRDDRYIKVDGMPMFHIYKLELIPKLDEFIRAFNLFAKKHGYNGIYLISTGRVHSNYVISNNNIKGVVGLDSFQKMRYAQRNIFFRIDTILGKIENRIYQKFNITTNNQLKRTRPIIIDYKKGIKKLSLTIPHKKYIQCVFPNWDNSPRCGNRSMIFKNSNPEIWKEYLVMALKKIDKHQENPPIIVIKSWNEWGEGNYLEPDLKYGKQWLQSIKEAKDGLSTSAI